MSLMLIGCGGLSVDGDQALPELSSADAKALCEDIESEGPLVCDGDTGESREDTDFSVSECQQSVQAAPDGCKLTAQEYYDASTDDPCRYVAQAFACYFQDVEEED